MTMTNKAILAACLMLAMGVAAGPAAAFCSKPVSPYCASDGNLADQYISAAKCRDNVKAHITGLSRYRTCLLDTIKKTDAELERFRNLISHKGDDAGR